MLMSALGWPEMDRRRKGMRKGSVGIERPLRGSVPGAPQGRRGGASSCLSSLVERLDEYCMEEANGWTHCEVWNAM